MTCYDSTGDLMVNERIAELTAENERLQKTLRAFGVSGDKGEKGVPAADYIPAKLHADVKADSNAKRIYISGPMTGVKNLNGEAFRLAEIRILEQGNIPINPHNFPEQKSYEDYLLFDLEILATSADAVVLLPGWEKSTGAKKELQLALELELEIIILEI